MRFGRKAVGDHAHAALHERVVDLDLLEGDRALPAHGLGDLGDLVDQLYWRDRFVEQHSLEAVGDAVEEPAQRIAAHHRHGAAAHHHEVASTLRKLIGFEPSMRMAPNSMPKPPKMPMIVAISTEGVLASKGRK